MKKVKIIVQILPDGTVRLKTIKNAGKACTSVAAGLSSFLGKPVPGSEGYTGDYFKTEIDSSIDVKQ